MMKKIAIAALVLSMATGFASMANAAGNDCAAKRAAIESQIAQAQKYGNIAKVNGLKIALAQLNANCTNEGLAADAQKKVQKLEKKLAEKKADVMEIQVDLRAAQAKGDAKKVAKYEKKIAEKKADVQEIEAELRAARAELAGLKG